MWEPWVVEGMTTSRIFWSATQIRLRMGRFRAEVHVAATGRSESLGLRDLSILDRFGDPIEYRSMTFGVTACHLVRGPSPTLKYHAAIAAVSDQLTAESAGKLYEEAIAGITWD